LQKNFNSMADELQQAIHKLRTERDHACSLSDASFLPTFPMSYGPPLPPCVDTWKVISQTRHI
jgi:hypothetical protein